MAVSSIFDVRHCERSEAIQLPFRGGNGLLRYARNDGFWARLGFKP
jgi:hypothetical protein